MIKTFLSRYEYGAFINGSFVEGSSLPRESLTNVVTKEEWKCLLPCDKERAYEAVEVAHEAFLKWKGETVFSRGNFLRQLGACLKKYQEELAYLITQEVGKPIKEARVEVEYSAGYFNWFASQVEQDKGSIVNSRYSNKRIFYLKEPIGVCALITPWNFPLAMASRKIAAALAAGCSVVSKPTPEAPLILLALGFISQQVGLPKGVLNIIPGEEKEIGNVLLTSPKVKKISFTGSTSVGKYLYEQSAETLKKVSLELGGNAPFIVFEDSPIEQVVSYALNCKFRFSGQTCVSANRFIIHEKCYQEFTEKFVEGTKKLRIGDPMEEETDLSPILHPTVIKRVKEFIKDAKGKQGKELLSGTHPYEPTLFGEVTTEMKLFKEEIFGPLAGICSFRTEEEALKLANNTPCGLAAYLFTKESSRIFRMTELLHFGIIGINDGSPSAPEIAFGGCLDSGFGREGGPEGIREYQTEKTLSIKIE